jgi:ankyrin repeat protein
MKKYSPILVLLFILSTNCFSSTAHYFNSQCGLPSKLYRAVEKNDFKLAKRLIDKGEPVDFQSSDCMSPLMLASLNGYNDIVVLLLNSGAKINLQRIFSKETAIGFASLRCNSETIQVLTKHGADLNSVDLLGLSPIFYPGYCSGKDDTESAALMLAATNALIAGNAHLNVLSGEGVSPLYGVASKSPKFQQVLELLLRNGANPNLGYSPLIIAAEFENIRTIKALINFDADVDAAINVLVSEYNNPIPLPCSQRPTNSYCGKIERKIKFLKSAQ